MNKDNLIIVWIFVCVVITAATTYMFTMSIAATTANDAFIDMCKENGYGGVLAVAPINGGFTITCTDEDLRFPQGLEVGDWNLSS